MKYIKEYITIPLLPLGQATPTSTCLQAGKGQSWYFHLLNSDTTLVILFEQKVRLRKLQIYGPKPKL